MFDNSPGLSPDHILEYDDRIVNQIGEDNQRTEEKKNAGTESEKEPSVQILNDSEFSSPARKKMMDSSIID